MSINIDDLKKDLKNNPVFNMSLSGKEVFHSNVLAWLLSETNNNDEATSTAKALTKLFPPKDLKADEKAEEKYRVLTVFREKNDFDLLIVYLEKDDYEGFKNEREKAAYDSKINIEDASDEIKSDRSENTCYELFMVLDCGDLERLGESKKYFESAEHTLNIDHHISNTMFGEYQYVIPEASSTSELVFHLIPKERMTKEIAECIYTGIVHDTGVFQYSCTKRSTMEAAGFLMEYGINYPKIVSETYFMKTFQQNKIFGTALMKSRLHLNGTCISAIITREDMDACGADVNDLSGIVSELRSTKGVETALFVYQTGEDEYKDISDSCPEAMPQIIFLLLHFRQ